MNLFPFSAVVAVAIDPSFVDTILNDSEADPKKGNFSDRRDLVSGYV